MSPEVRLALEAAADTVLRARHKDEWEQILADMLNVWDR